MPIQTRAQYDTVKEALRLELERPEAEQDLAFIERAITELLVAEEQFADQIDPSRAAAQQAAQGTAMESLVPPPASDAAVQQGALSQLDLGDMGQLPAQSHAMSQGVNERLRSMQDMLARAVLDKDEQAAR